MVYLLSIHLLPQPTLAHFVSSCCRSARICLFVCRTFTFTAAVNKCTATDGWVERREPHMQTAHKGFQSGSPRNTQTHTAAQEDDACAHMNPAASKQNAAVFCRRVSAHHVDCARLCMRPMSRTHAHTPAALLHRCARAHQCKA